MQKRFNGGRVSHCSKYATDCYVYNWNQVNIQDCLNRKLLIQVKLANEGIRKTFGLLLSTNLRTNFGYENTIPKCRIYQIRQTEFLRLLAFSASAFLFEACINKFSGWIITTMETNELISQGIEQKRIKSIKHLSDTWQKDRLYIFICICIVLLSWT